MKCVHSGCDRTAECVPKICVPAKGMHAFMIPEAHVIYNLPLCRPHFTDLHPRDFLRDSRVRELFGITLRAAGSYLTQLPECDFEKTNVKRVALDSDEYGLFLRQEDRNRRQSEAIKASKPPAPPAILDRRK